MPIDTYTDAPIDTSTAEALDSSTELAQPDAQQAAVSGGELVQTVALNMAAIAGAFAGTIAGALSAPLTASAAIAPAQEDGADQPVEPDEQLGEALDAPAGTSPAGDAVAP